MVPEPQERPTSVAGMRRVTALLLVLALAGLGAACSSSEGAQDAPLRLASIASATGSASAYGVNAQRGVELAVSELGDGRIDLRTYDDRSTSAGAADATRSAVEWGADVVFAPTLSPVALSIAPTLAQDRIPALGVSNATIDLDAAGAWFWRVSKSENDMVAASVGAAATRGQRAVLIWEPSDGYSVGSRQAFLDAAAARGVTIVSELQFVEGSTTPESVARRAGESSPDLLLMALRSAVAADFLTATAASSAVRIGGNGFNSVEVITKAGRAADGLVVAGSWNLDAPTAMSPSFIEAYTAAHGSPPDSFAAQGYASVQVLLAAVRAGGGTTPGHIQRGLASLGARTNDVPSVLGPFGYTSGREPTYPAVVQVVRSGALEPLG